MTGRERVMKRGVKGVIVSVEPERLKLEESDAPAFSSDYLILFATHCGSAQLSLAEDEREGKTDPAHPVSRLVHFGPHTLKERERLSEPSLRREGGP